MKLLLYLLILFCPFFLHAQHFGFLHEISSYSPSGTNEVQFTGLSAGLARNKLTGNLIATTGSLILIIDQDNGKFIARFGNDENLYGYITAVTIDNNGNYYILQNNFVLKYDPYGKYLSTWGGTGSADGQLNNPTSVCSDDMNNIYITDAGNRRVQKFDALGNFKTKWGSNGSGNGQFSMPQGIAYLPATDQIIVGDFSNGNVQSFSRNGDFIATSLAIGTINSIDVDVTSSTVLILTNNYIYQLDSGLTKLNQWGPNGTGGALTLMSGVSSIVVGYSSGNPATTRLFAVDKSRLVSFILGGAANGNVGASYGSDGTALGQFDKPAAADYSRMGSTLHVVDWGKIDPITQITSATLNKGVTLKTPSSIAMKLPWALMTDQNYQYILDNTLIPSPNHLNIYKFNISDNSYAATISFGIININAVTMDRNGNFYFAKQSGASYIIYKFDNTGTLTTQWNTPAISLGLMNMYLATDASNNVYATTSDDYGTPKTQILKYSSTGTLLNQFGVRGSIPGTLGVIQSIDVDDSGNIFVLEANRVQVFDAAFNFLQQMNLPQGIHPGEMDDPFLLRVNAAGNEFAILDNKALNRVQYFKIKTDQVISFAPLANKTDIDPPFQLSAVGTTSGIPVTYKSSNSAVATITGTTVTIVGPGTTMITASQGGNASYNAAPDVLQQLTVTSGKTAQVIQFSNLPSKVYGSNPFAINATGGASGNPILYVSSNTNVATVAGSIVTIVGAGNTIITASQLGNANYTTAADVPQSLTVTKADQVITFNSLPDKSINDSPFALTATGGLSGNPVTYVSSNTSVASISAGTVTLLSSGSTMITAHQVGNANYNAAPDVPRTLIVTNLLSQEITFPLLSDKVIGEAPFVLAASSSSGLSVTYSSEADEIVLTNSQVTMLKAGHVIINADQNGNGNYHSALRVSQSFCINPATPVVSESFVTPSAPVLMSNSANGNQWFLNDVAIEGATATSYTVTAPGLYTVQVNAEACVSAKSQVHSMVITGVKKESIQLTCFPNPASSSIMIMGTLSSDAQIIIYNSNGQLIEKGGTEYLNREITLADYTTGVYFIRVIAEGESVIRKFIKQ